MTDEKGPVSDQWMLRSPDGREYGPVSFDMLRAWAAQNRFTAGYSVTSNRQDWRPVESVPELGMDWFVEPGDGNRYGPFHPLALLDYVREGAVPPETRVIHKVNRGEAKAYQVLLEAFVDAIDQTGEVQGELVRQVQALEERLEERDRWFTAESKALQDERERRQELELELRRLQEQGSPSAELQARQAQLESDLAQARKDTDFERRAHKDTRAAMADEMHNIRTDADRRLKEMEQRLAAVQAAAETDKRELERVDRLRVEAEGKLRTLGVGEARVREELAALKASWQGDSEALKQDLQHARAEVERVRRDLGTRLNEAQVQAAQNAAAASLAEAELAALKGVTERLRQASVQEQAEIKARAVTETRGEAERLAAALEKSQVDKAALSELLEKERQARIREKADLTSRQDAEAQQREVAETLTREVTALRRENASLLQRLESARVEVDESARTEQELLQLRQSVVSLQKRLSEAETVSAKTKAELGTALEQEARAAREQKVQAAQWQAEFHRLEGERDRQAELVNDFKTKLERVDKRALQIQEQAENGLREQASLSRELDSSRARIRTLEARLNEKPKTETAQGSRASWASGPIVDVPADEDGSRTREAPPPPSTPPPRMSGNLANLEAQAQAELRAWQEKKQAPPKTEPPPKPKSWLPWK